MAFSTRYWERKGKRFRNTLHWALAVNRQPWLPPGRSSSFLFVRLGNGSRAQAARLQSGPGRGPVMGHWP
eukprot:8443336-Pyramimonas_sp.AAC.1